jgi:DNA-directed RNA polymerase specialized sigma24 family protein
MKALQRLLSGERGGPAAVAKAAGVSQEDLAEGVVRYVLSAEYKDDIAQVLHALGLDARQVIQATVEMEFAAGQTPIVEKLLEKANLLSPAGHQVRPTGRQKGRSSAPGSRSLSMSSGGSVTASIAQLKAGERASVQHLWARYFERLVLLARRQLRGASRRAADEEDLALSAFVSFSRGAAEGRFPLLSDRDDLWRLLVDLTARKEVRSLQRERREKRGGGKVQSETRLDPNMGPEGPVVEQILGREPTPEFAAKVAEQLRLLLDRLGDTGLRSIALWKMEGYTNKEIAAKLGFVERTVERKLRLIRSLWEQELAA